MKKGRDVVMSIDAEEGRLIISGKEKNVDFLLTVSSPTIANTKFPLESFEQILNVVRGGFIECAKDE
jgi:hypothetical protein